MLGLKLTMLVKVATGVTEVLNQDIRIGFEPATATRTLLSPLLVFLNEVSF